MTNSVTTHKHRRFTFVKWFVPLVTILWLTYAVVVLSNAGIQLPDFLILVYSGIALAICWCVQLLLTLYKARNASLLRKVRAYKRLSIIPIALLLGAGFLFTPTLFMLRVKLSEPVLLDYIHNVQHQPHPSVNADGPQHIGLFTIHKTESQANTLWLALTDCGFADTCGLVYHANGTPPYVSEDSYEHLWGPWWQWHRSW